MSENDSISLISVTGPTASGKTSLAIKIAKEINAEIINADSIQVYKHFDIGSAKPTKAELEEIPHHLISIVEPYEEFNAGIFIKFAKAAIENILSRGKNVVLCGGTGLYLKALLHGLLAIDRIPDKVEEEFAIKYKKLTEQTTNTQDLTLELYKWLIEIDSESTGKVNPKDQQRISRAILVKLATDKSIFTLQKEHAHQTIFYNCLNFCLLPPRELLYEQINDRVDKMLAQGLIAETRNIIEKFGNSPKALKSIGYAQTEQFLNGELTEEDLHLEIKKQTRRFAKRQYTWWRHQPSSLNWINIETHTENYSKVYENCHYFLEKKYPFSDGKIFIQELTDRLTKD